MKSHPPVWMMVREAASALGGSVTRREIAKWILLRYPGTRANTISCQTTICTVNNPVRVQFQQNSRPRTELNQYDFLFQRDDGVLEKYSPRRHGRWIIVRTKQGAVAIRRASHTGAVVTTSQRLHVFFCGAPRENRDYAYLTDLAENGGTTNWASLKEARAGDRVLFYTVQERRAFMASGWIHRSAKPTGDSDDYAYRSVIGSVRLLTQPVPRSVIRQKFSSWGWPRYTRNITTVPERIADLLWSLVHQIGETAPAPTPPANSGASSPKRGAGFGKPDSNGLVEAAAIAAAKRHLKGKGYRVRSREREKIGYDLDATKGTQKLHVEVKGVSGDGCSFIITQNEVATARIDPLFRLLVVSSARSRRPVISEFKGTELDLQFGLTPISFFASKR